MSNRTGDRMDHLTPRCDRQAFANHGQRVPHRPPGQAQRPWDDRGFVGCRSESLRLEGRHPTRRASQPRNSRHVSRRGVSPRGRRSRFRSELPPRKWGAFDESHFVKRKRPQIVRGIRRERLTTRGKFRDRESHVVGVSLAFLCRFGVIVQTLCDPERNPVGSASCRQEGNDPAVDQFSLPVDAIKILNRRSGLGSNACHLRNPRVADRDRPVGQTPFQLCTKLYRQMREETSPAPARRGKDKGRTDRSFPQIAQMVERGAGLSFGVIESLPLGGRVRLVF